MFVRILSDIHTEIFPYEVEYLPTDKDTILVLAGDCGLFKHVEYAGWVKKLAPSFRKVLLIPGNHEFYSGKMHTEQAKFEERVANENVHVLQNQSLVIDDVLFVGGTLWTSFRSGNPMLMLDAERAMNDYYKIRVASNGYRKLRATDVLVEHQKTRNFIFDTVERERTNYEKIVVLTHHAPSRLSISPRFAGDRLNDLYVNDFEYWIENNKPLLWVHGHVHDSMDYVVGDTRILCNPRGYAFVNKNGVRVNENPLFNPTLIIEV